MSTRYVRIALGSLAEAETQLLMAGRLNYISMTEIAVLMERADHVGRMLRRLGQALHRKVRLTTP